MQISSGAKGRRGVTTMIEQDTFESREYFDKALKMIARGEYAEASGLIEDALKISPENPLYISCMGLCIGMRGNTFVGEKMCRKAMGMPKTPDATFNVNLGRILLKQGNREGARNCFTKAYSIDNTHSPAALELSRMGVRKKPVLSCIRRDHPINIWLGKLRHRIRVMKNPGLKKL
ncbi:MAG: tetratricopeptide repeat protein [Bacteroidales bacterium]|nr:tetratricopeptide repeat protein [Candidatus Latescibacterota bacterium]